MHTAILGVDAAWTAHEPSGVALIEGVPGAWRVVAVAPSYNAFIDFCNGTAIDWARPRFVGSRPDVRSLLDAARNITTATLRVVAVDMPLATTPFTTRRSADRAVSKAFGARGCSTHSPSALRPGKIGQDLMAQLASSGFPLATGNTPNRKAPCTIEVYPHPALLSLLHCDFRLPYKVSRSASYWPGTSIRERVGLVLHNLTRIDASLRAIFGETRVALPSIEKVVRLSELKRHEDALDAVICAWVGTRFVEGLAQPYGDELAAIWVPESAAAL